ncbi:MAG: rRNA maturation RNase YbeY [Myxococcota bacterium]
MMHGWDTLVVAHDGAQTLVPAVRRVVRKLVPVMFGRGAGVGVRLVDDAEMKALQRDFRGKTGLTDVLSFPGDEGYVGDIAISPTVARRQAKEMGHPVATELAVLTVHGLVHLAGLDHENSHDEALLQAEVEMGLLSLIGVKPEAALGRRGI